MVKKTTQIILALILLFAMPLMASAMTLVWDPYSDELADSFTIYHSTDQSNWVELVENIPTSYIATEIPDGADNTRIYYMMRAVFADGESGNSNVVTYYWTTGGGGHTGPAAVGGVSLLDCGPLDNIADDGSPEWDICNERYQP